METFPRFATASSPTPHHTHTDRAHGTRQLCRSPPYLFPAVAVAFRFAAASARFLASSRFLSRASARAAARPSSASWRSAMSLGGAVAGVSSGLCSCK